MEREEDLPIVLDAAQVARLLNLNIDYVRKLTRQGVLPASRLPGGRAYRYFRDDVLQWLRDQRVGERDSSEARAEG